MKILLDTHVFLWLQTTPERLNAEALAAAGEADNDVLLSAASSWEIAIKYALGKLHLPEPPAVHIPDRMSRSGVRGVPVQHAHALHVATLPAHHHDPFDRLLIAQAQLDGLTILTADPVFERYGVELMWAT